MLVQDMQVYLLTSVVLLQNGLLKVLKLLHLKMVLLLVNWKVMLLLKLQN